MQQQQQQQQQHNTLDEGFQIHGRVGWALVPPFGLKDRLVKAGVAWNRIIQG
jgi:hypothetical protein